MSDSADFEDNGNGRLKMEEGEKSEMKVLSKLLSKLWKKSSKMMNIIASQTGVQFSVVPTQWVALWGLGIAGGNSKQFIKSYLKPSPIEIRFISEKTYCFLKLSTKEDASLLRTAYNGKAFQELQTIYVGYLVGEPPLENRDAIESFKGVRPQGLTLLQDFISPEEEIMLIDNLSPKTCDQLGAVLKRRWVTHFGYEFRYETNDVDFDSPLEAGIPTYLLPIINRMMSAKLIPLPPDQLTVNHYLPGQGIPPHVDTHSCFDDHIVSLSLGSNTVMDFRSDRGHVSVVLPSRSLLVMSNELRYGWTHCIPNRKLDIVPDQMDNSLDILPREPRTSLTFRILRKSNICTCLFPNMCNSQNGKITKENATDLENKLVHDVYEKIASHFDVTRHTPWPKVEEFVKNMTEGESLLDVGCGNGKYFNLNSKIFQVGTDMSVGLLEIAKEKTGDFVRANAIQMPFRDEMFDSVICIAVLHHISTEERRKTALQEMMRVLSRTGTALVYVWAKDQKDSNFASKQTVKKNPQYNFVTDKAQPIIDYSFLPIYDHEKVFPRNDMIVPWVNTKESKSSVQHRFYHVFNQGELEELISSIVPVPTILASYYDQGNWVVKLQKT